MELQAWSQAGSSADCLGALRVMMLVITVVAVVTVERRRTAACERWLEKTLESPLDCKEIQPVHPKGDQSWVFFGRTDAKAETPILWPPHAKS